MRWMGSYSTRMNSEIGKLLQSPKIGDSERAGEGLRLLPDAATVVPPPPRRATFGGRPRPRFAAALEDSPASFRGRPLPRFATTGGANSISFFGAMVERRERRKMEEEVEDEGENTKEPLLIAGLGRSPTVREATPGDTW